MGTADKITILNCLDGRAVKTFHADGRTEPYRAGMLFSWEERKLSSLDDLATLLVQIQDVQDSFIIRGAPVTTLAAAGAVRRKKENFNDTPHHWLMLDIDNVGLPTGIHPVSPEALTFIVGLLPAEFQNVSFVAQWSNSAGLKPGVGKVHLWYWLETPLGSADLRAWAKTLDQLVDPAVFNTVQPHYTARPVFHGIADPAPLRTCHVKLTIDSVSLVVVPRPALTMVRNLSLPQQTTNGSALQGKIADGREKWLVGERYRILRDEPPDSLEAFAEATWDSFAASCEVDTTSGSGNTYSAAVIADKCRYDWEKYGRGEFDFQRLPTATLPPFVDRTVPLDEGLAQLTDAIREFLDQPRHTAIRITSGAGKTSTLCVELVKKLQKLRSQGLHKVVHFYATTHALKSEIAERLRRLDPSLKVKDVIGRIPDTCDRYGLTKELRDLRLSIQRICCDASSQRAVIGTAMKQSMKCPHFDNCTYQKQFAEPADIYLFSKPYLLASRRADVLAPDFVVIDEDFIQTLIDTPKAGLEDLLRLPASTSADARRALKIVRDALAAGQPVLKQLREAGFDAASLGELAVDINKHRTKRLGLNILPGMSADHIARQAERIGPEHIGFLALKALATEIGHRRDDAYSVVYQNSKLFVRLLRDSEVFQTPTLVLDATADEELIRVVLPSATFRAIEVPRKTHVVQVQNRRLSKFALIEDSRRDQTTALIQESIDRISERHQSGLLVTFKEIEENFALPPKWKRNHFGNIRGIDSYKDLEAVVIVGTYLVPPLVVEHTAGALAARLPGTRAFSGDYVDMTRQFRLRTGEGNSSVWAHPDPFAQRVLEQKREAEMLQAIDRLRLIHSPATKPVFILSSCPLDLTVDELVTLEQLAGRDDYLGQLLEHLAGVVPLRASILHQRRPDLFRSEKIAEKWAAPYTPKPQIVSIRQAGVKELHAKAVGQKGPSSTRVLVRDDHPAPRSAVTHLLGELASYDGASDREPAVFVDVHGTGEVIGAKIVQYVDPEPFGPHGWKQIPMPADMYWVFNPPLILRPGERPQKREAYPFGRS